ncbi:MAG: glycosyltransferase family 4 protein [Phycisphaerales bacterium]|jgi:glycosyltransferase involved in cell wall biosynthesis|nr:glycosyltransferase family 4 protein [Phycisphaerales bacterium]MBT7171216.1 glycosyltransferase family 4 protein [Phycisphaerales bacterium]
MTRLRIAYILPTLGRGGAEACVLTLARGLDRSRFEPVVIALRGGAMRADFEAAGIEVRCCEMRCRFDIARLWRLRKWLREFDLIHSHLFRAGQAVNLFARKSVPWCHTIHTFEPRRLGPCRANHIAVAQSVAEFHSRRNRRTSADYAVISNGVDVAHFADASALRPQWRGQWSVGGGEFVVAWVGRNHPDKGVDLLREVIAEMARRNRPVTWLVAGEGLGAVVANAPEGAKVLAPGFVEASGVLAAADAVLLTSQIEGFPLVMCEAMAAGRAVIAPAVGGISEIVTNETTGLLPERTSAALADALERLIGDAPLRNRLEESAQTVAIERLNVDTMISEHQNQYDLMTATGESHAD